MRIQVAGHTLYAECRGDRPEIVFVHGLGASGSIWFATAQAVGSHRTIAYDWLGSGASDRPLTDYSIERFAVEAAGVCDRLDCDRPFIVAHSMAAAVGVTLAARRPDLVRGLALLGPVVQLKEPAITTFRERAAKVRAEGMGPIAETLPLGALSPASRESNPALHGLFRAMILANDPEIYARHCEALLGSTAAALVPEVQCPVLLLAGEHDPTAPPAAVHELAARFRSASTATIAGAGHAMQLDQPRAVADAISAFASGLT